VQPESRSRALQLLAFVDHHPLSFPTDKASRVCQSTYASRCVSFLSRRLQLPDIPGSVTPSEGRLNALAFSLYDATVANYLQILGAVGGFLEKSLTHFREEGIDTAEIVETRLASDMLSFRFQIISIAHHSRGAMEAAKNGVFLPSSDKPELDYAALQALVTEARNELSALTPEAVNALVGRDVIFKVGERTVPFTAEGFLMSFSLPNFFFHATTAYDILRHKGAPLGKRDFVGKMRLKK
jgi:hypothetical protein